MPEDKNGVLDSTEVYHLLERLGLHPTQEDTAHLMQSLHATDGQFTFPQFVAAFSLMEPLDVVAMYTHDAE